MNYAAQSEMLVYLLKSVRGLVEQKQYNDVDEAIKVMSSWNCGNPSNPDTNGAGDSVRISEVSLFQRCPYSRGVLITEEVSLFQGCPNYRGGVLIPGVS